MLIYLAMLDGEAERIAFTELYDENLSFMMQTASRFFSDRARMEDAVHNAFLVVARDFKKFLLIPCPERAPYLVTIVKNKCRDILRSEKKYSDFPEDDGKMLNSIPAPDLSGLNDDYKRAVTLIYQLPDSFQEVLECRLILGLSNLETAKRLNISQDLSSKRYNRGRAIIAKTLDEEGVGCDG